MSSILDNIGDAASSAGHSISDATSNAGQKLSEFMSSPQAKKLLPYLLSGGAGAVAGGVLTGKRRKREGEGRLAHLGRVLGNAAITGGLAAGGHALINKGLDNTVGAVDEKNALTGSAANQGPLSSTAKDIAFSPLTAGAAGVGALAATHKGDMLGAGLSGKKDALDALVKRVGGSSNATFKTNSPLENRTALGGNKDLHRLADRAGLITEDGLKGALQKLTRKGPLSTFGRTPGRAIGRAGLGLAAASIPALAGALLTEEKHPA